MGEFVRLEVADGVGTIRLDRPKMNAISIAVQEELRAAAAEATERDDVRAVVLYGGDRVFAAGDITEYPGKVRLIAVGFGEAATAVNNATVAIDPTAKVFPGHSSEGG